MLISLLTHWPLGFDYSLRLVNFKPVSMINTLSSVKLLSGECKTTH